MTENENANAVGNPTIKILPPTIPGAESKPREEPSPSEPDPRPDLATAQRQDTAA